MNKFIIGLSLTLVLCGTLIAQKKVDTNTSANAGQNSSVGSGIASGTQVSGQLQNSLDVQKANVGDQVLLKTTKAVKQGGQVVIAKGSTLVGRVTEVAKRTKGNAGSSIGVLFDSIRQGGSQMPITASITSVLQAATAASFDSTDNSGMMSTSGQASTRSSSSGGGGGGLLGGVGNTVGGVTNTVGGVANSATQTVGGLTNTVGQTVGSTTGSLAGSVRGLSISQSSSASAQGGSTLSMSNGNLRLDKGTTFNLSVSNSSSVGKN